MGGARKTKAEDLEAGAVPDVPPPPTFEEVQRVLREQLERILAAVNAAAANMPEGMEPQVQRLRAVIAGAIQASDLEALRGAIERDVLAVVLAGAGPVKHHAVHHA